MCFESSHVTGDFSSGELTVRVTREDDLRNISRSDEIWFEVPRDFHTHDDSVAAALMTLVGRSCPVVSFNFPISERCAEILRLHYNLADVGPVAAGLESRRRGRHLGLMLSGGFDSMALWLVLKRVLGDEFKVITTDFGRPFTFESRGFLQFHRDVTCRTNLRRKGFGNEGRFTAAVPLLFADYADLAAVTTGHHYVHIPLSVESLRDGATPGFLTNDRPLNAGGLDEVHFVRCLNFTALLLLAMLAEPEMLEACWHGSAPPGTAKHYDKGLIFRYLFQRQGRDVPAWLDEIARPRHRQRFAEGVILRFTPLYQTKRLGVDAVRPVIRDLDRYDLSFLDDLAMTFMEGYNTNLTGLIPEKLRAGVLGVFHEAGILPYSERDWDELEQVRAFCLAHSDMYS